MRGRAMLAALRPPADRAARNAGPCAASARGPSSVGGTASRLLAVLVTACASLTCDLITSPRGKSAIRVDYAGSTRLVVGTAVSFTPTVTDNNVPLDGPRLRVVTSDSSVIAVQDLDGGFTFKLHARRRGHALVSASLVSSTLTDAPPRTEVTFTAVAAGLAIDSSAITFHSLNDTLTAPVIVRDGVGGVLEEAVADARWSSSDPAVARVDSLSGRVTARGNGTALVVATIDSCVADTVAVTVLQRLTRYAFTPASLVLASLNKDTLVSVTPLDAGGSAIAGVTLPSPLFSTLNAGVVSVTAAGVVTSTGNGATGIRVQGPGTSADDTLAVTVGQVATRVEIAGARTDTIEALQDTLLLRAVAVDAQGVEVRGRGVTWFSRQSLLVQVNPTSGWTRGVGEGETRILAQLDAATDSVTVVVRDVPRSVRTTPSVHFTTIGDSARLADTAFNRLGALVPGVATTWRALDPAIAAVDASDGIAVARGVGATLVVGTITGGYADTTSVVVENRVAAVDITQPDTSLGSVGDTVTVRTAVANARGAAMPLSAVAWSPADTTVLSVANGFVTALRAGVSTVHAIDRVNTAIRDSVRITVTNAPVSVILNRVLDTLTAPTRTLQYDVVVRNARGGVLASPEVTWRSTNATVATVSLAGQATAQAAGTTLIVAEAGSGTALAADTATLVVTNDAVSLTVSPTDVTIPSVGATVALRADARNAVGGSVTGVTFVWSSSDTTVAQVSAAGTVTGVAVGSATVTARLASLSASAAIKVTNAPDLIDIGPTAVTLASVNDTVIPDVTLHNALGAALPRGAAQWLSDDAAIAQVTTEGVVIAAGRGATKVRARNADNLARQDSLSVTVTNAPDSVNVDRTVDSLPSLNRTIAYTAVVFNARHQIIENEPVAWVSRNPSIATISATGIATSVGIGNTWIVGSSGVAADSAVLIVSNRAATVTISPSTLTLHAVGDSAPLSAVARNELGNVIVGASVAWATQDSTVVRVSAGGIVRAVGTGTTSVTATVDGVAASIPVTVANEIASLSITSGPVTLASVGDAVTLSVDIRNTLGASLPSNAALWTTGDANVATVSGAGVVTATGAGQTTVSATSPTNGSITSAVTVTVTNAPVSIVLNRSADTLTAFGRTLSYAAVVRNARGDVITNATVGWTSSQPAVASIGAQTGLATALAVGGPVTITGTTANHLTAAASLVVTNDAVSISLTPDTASILNLGGTLQMSAVAPNDLNNLVPASFISWSHLEPAIATVSSSGLVTAVSAGTARVVAAVNAYPNTKADTSYITVANAPTTVSITSGDLTLASIGDTVRPAATISGAAGPLPRTAVNWTSSATNVATVTNAGLVTAQGEGITTITATSPYNPLVTSSINVTVTNAPATVVLNASSVTLTALTRTTTFTAAVRNLRGDPLTGHEVNFTSSAPTRVDVGLTTGTATAMDTTPAGNPATITASVVDAPSVTATASVMVTNRAASVAVIPSSVTLTALSATATLTSTSRNDLGAVVPNAPVTWGSSNTSVATIPAGPTTGTGVVTAAGVGTATVTVTSNGFTAATSVSVSNELTTLEITPDSGVIDALGGTLTPAVVFQNSLGATLPRSSATWSTSNANVATVTGSGVITGVGVGTAIITAASPTNAGLSDFMAVSVYNPTASVTLSPSLPQTLTAIGRTLSYTATVKNAAGTVIPGATVSWGVTDSAAADIDGNGVVTANAVGTLSVIAASGGKADTGALTITNLPASVSLSPASLALTAVGASDTLSAVSRNDLGNVVPDAPVTWQSSNTGIVTVPAATTLDTGRVTAKGVGSATVTVTSNGHIATASVAVTNDLTFLQITPDTGTIGALGGTLTPAVVFRNSLDSVLPRSAATWTTSNGAIAAVSSGGVITGVGAGTAVVTATSPANATIKDSIGVTVLNPAASVTLSPSTAQTLTAVGRTITYTATVKNAAGTVIPGAPVTWHSSADTVATIDANGVATAVGVGTTLITAASGTATSADATLHVTNLPVSVSLSPTSLALTAVGATGTLTATARNDLGSVIPGAPITWSSSKTTVATVPAGPTTGTGVVTAVKVGSATITATTSNGKSDDASVTVTNGLDTLRIVDSASCLIAVHDTAYPAVVFRNSIGDTLPRTAATWGQSDGAVVTVSSSGVITARGMGTAYVTASTADGSLSDTIWVTVDNVVHSVTVSPSEPRTLPAPKDTLRYSATAANSCGANLAAATFTWTSSRPSVATVSSSGLATAVDTGTTSIIAASGGAADSAALTVTNAPVSVTVTPAGTTTLNVGDTLTYRATVLNVRGDSIAGATVRWSSDDTASVSIDSVTGLATAKAATAVGSPVTLTATVVGATSVKGTAKMEVTGP